MSPRENPPRDEGARDEGAKQAAEAAEAKQAEVKETPGDEVPPEQVSAEVEEEAPEEEAKPSRRRGSAETGAAAERRAAPRRADGAVVVKARARYVRSAPRKARLMMDHIRGRPVEQARAMLQHAPRAVSADIMKLLNSAIANAEANYELAPDELRVERAFVDEGPIIKRYRPRALGRATRINKRTSHMTIELTTTSEGA